MALLLFLLDYEGILLSCQMFVKLIIIMLIIDKIDIRIMTHRPTIRQLSYLVALAEHENFSRAAESCFVTQSTLSAGIMELENLLGAPLVERSKRMVRVTALGLEIVRRAGDILTRTDDLVDFVKSASEPLSGEIRLGAIPTIGPFVLPKLMRGLKKTYPGLKLYLREGQTAETVDLLSRGFLDIALLAFPYPTSGLEVEILGLDAFSLVCPAGHRLSRKAEIAASALEAEKLLLLEEGHCLRDHALSVCNIHHLTSREEFKATSLETLVLMVEEGLGLTLVPELAIRAGLLKGKNVTAVPLTGTATGRDIGLAWRSSSARGGEYHLLGDQVRKLMP